jgi:uncharacterized protein YecE (DUF72 family)
MKIQTVSDYNSEDMRKWQKRVDEWQEDKFTSNIIPQVAFVGFRTRTGEMRKCGYVASDENHAYYAKTKREAILKYNQL